MDAYSRFESVSHVWYQFIQKTNFTKIKQRQQALLKQVKQIKLDMDDLQEEARELNRQIKQKIAVAKSNKKDQADINKIYKKIGI